MKTMSKSVHHLCSLLILLCISIFVSSCSSDAPTPRRYAYPRVDTYPQKYSSIVNSADVNIEVNTAARIVADSVADADTWWITLSYPKYKANLYITVNKCNSKSQLQDVIANRVQRISLNTGGKDFEQVDLQSEEDFKSKIFTIRGGSMNPVMFISSNQRNCVVSGSLYFLDSNAVSKVDSIAPIIDAVSNDIIHLAKHLR